ncbi:hypothetical protein C2845_PM17G03900 [Panicum miliaceum]|uniref:GATA-type domain-containing protein n=1 Tax=Panicum miliaceum TaxID=4540 RepID=A0A3L6Q3M8_PANMI|nr:hypothetical protein C2845_PM17G03900 [Panicum miliaceum]
MRTQPHLSLRDVPEDLPDCDGGCFRPGGGLCCPDDPLDLVLQFFSDPSPQEASLEALGIRGSPRRQEQPPAPLGWGQENGFGGVRLLGGGGCGETEPSRVPDDTEPIDVDKYLVNVAPDGEATVCNPARDTGGIPAAAPAGGVRACGALGGVVSNGAPPLLPPMSAGALHPYTFCAFDGGVVSSVEPPLPPPMPAGGGPHWCGALVGVASDVAPPVPAGALHACRALVGGTISNNAPPPWAHAPPSAWALPAFRTSSGCLTPTTSETSSPAPAWQPLSWVVPRKRRHPPVMRHKRPWSLEFPLHALPAAPPDNPGDNNGDENAKNSCDNAAGGGIRRRRPVPRQRNRQAQRVCSHCHSPDTPQWRAGPDGPGTLCNACGIRYAANKLLPEYRPSTSPSFRSDQHSNRHRKVVKLREQKAKELSPKAMPDPAPVPSPPPPPPKSDEFMDVCTYISTG